MEKEFTDQTDDELQAVRMLLEEDIRKLANMRHLNPSKEDALAGYEAFVAEARQIVAAGWDQQAASLRAVGRVGTANTEWRIPTRFCEAQEIIRDDRGPRALMAAVEALEFGLGHAEIQAESNQKRETIGRILAELAHRTAGRSMAQASIVLDDELSKIRS